MCSQPSFSDGKKMSSPFVATSQLPAVPPCTKLDVRRDRVLRDRRSLSGLEIGDEHRDAFRTAERVEQVQLVRLPGPLEGGEAAHAVHDRRRLLVDHAHVAPGFDVEHVRVVANEHCVARRGIRIQHVPRLISRRRIEGILPDVTLVDADDGDLFRVGRPDQLRTLACGPLRRQRAGFANPVRVLVDPVGGELDRAVRQRQGVDARVAATGAAAATSRR